MDYSHADMPQMGLSHKELFAMSDYLTKARHFPKILVTQNSAVMQKAYTMVPAEVWWERLHDLQDALHNYKGDAGVRRIIATGRASGLSPQIDSILDAAFIDKYEHLINRVVYDFENFFPYRITRTNQKLMIFEMMDDTRLIEHVLRRL